MFVVYLSSNQYTDGHGNCYGYFAGKCYTKEEYVFPITDNGVTERTKKYKSKKMALKGAESVFNKCAYVLTYEIEEINN